MAAAAAALAAAVAEIARLWFVGGASWESVLSNLYAEIAIRNFWH